MQPKIAICISTYNRPDVLYQCLEQQAKYLPFGAKIFVVDDGSTDRPDASKIEQAIDYAPLYYYENGVNRGIAATKNKCLELADAWGAEHIFLFDSDTWPIAPDWWVPYVESKEPHLMYQFRLPGKPDKDMQVIYQDESVVAYTHTRGAMIYVERRVLDVVGGLDTNYGLAYFEHPDWTNRIHNAGLTTYRAMDVPNSRKLIYCLDQNGYVRSSISRSVKPKGSLYVRQKQSKEYKEFRV